MPRPRKVSDEDILRAAWRVMARRGVDAFTLAEVAAEVRLSRAAISLRFESVRVLRLRMAERAVRRIEEELALAPAGRTGDALIMLAGITGAMMPDPARLALSARRDFEDEEIAPVAKQRTAVVLKALSERMPDTRMARDEAVRSLLTHWSGAMLSCPADVSVSEYMMRSTKKWLAFAEIPFSDEPVDMAPIEAAHKRSAYYEPE